MSSNKRRRKDKTMTKQKIYGICCGNIFNTSFGFDEENENFISFKEAITGHLSSLEGAVMTTCNIGLELIAAETALSQNKDLICVIPFEGQADKWSEFYRERYFGVHEKSKRTVNLSSCFNNNNSYEADEYIAENCDELIVILSKGEGLPYTARRALELNKRVTIIDCDNFSVVNLK